MARAMKDSGVDWIGQIPENWKVERLSGHLKEINEKNCPLKTTQILSLTNKLGVIPYEEKGNQGNKAKENYEEYKVAYKDTIIANSMNILIGSVCSGSLVFSDSTHCSTFLISNSEIRPTLAYVIASCTS